MLKLFRKIRYDLTSGEKTYRYLKYAIGEIFLVVIGILIALQINNWNVHRLEKIKTRSYISNIKNDLYTDIENLNDLINYSINQSKDIDAFYKHISLNKPTITNTLDSSLLLNTPFYRYFPVNQTFLDMQSSGHSALLSETQRKSLIDLIYLQDRLQIANEKIIQIAISEISARNQYITERNDFNKLFNLQDDIESYTHALLHQINYLDEMKDLGKVMERFGSMIKDQSLEVKKQLEKY